MIPRLIRLPACEWLARRRESRRERTEGGAIGSKVFVGNLSFETTAEELQALFSDVAEGVQVVVPTDRMTGRPRGFAFVEFPSSEQAAEAIRKFDGTEVAGRRLRVNEATGERGGGGGFGGGGGGAGFNRGPFGADRPARRPFRAKGSRRNARARKRSIR